MAKHNGGRGCNVIGTRVKCQGYWSSQYQSSGMKYDTTHATLTRQTAASKMHGFESYWALNRLGRLYG